MRKYLNLNGLEDAEANKTSAISKFIPQMLADDETAQGANSLNSKQMQVFSVVHTWVKCYVNHIEHNVYFR